MNYCGQFYWYSFWLQLCRQRGVDQDIQRRMLITSLNIAVCEDLESLKCLPWLFWRFWLLREKNVWTNIVLDSG